MSRADILRAIAAVPDSAAGGERVLPAGARTVVEAATTEVPLLAPDAPADEVLAAVVLGIVSDRDPLARSSPDMRTRILEILGNWRAPLADRPVAILEAGGA